MSPNRRRNPGNMQGVERDCGGAPAGIKIGAVLSPM